MKIRTDFVTNSSSSSFILARKSEFNENQKEAIIKLVEERLLGKILLSPDNTEEEISKVFEDDEYRWDLQDEEDQKAIRKALAEGKTIYRDVVDFEVYDFDLAEIYKSVWRALEENSDGDFVTIDGDLYY